MNYLCHLLAPEVLGELVLVLGELQLGVLEYLHHVLLLADLDHAAALHLAHLLGGLLDLLLDLLPLGRVLDALADVGGGVQEVLVEVVGEHGVGLGEVVAR